MIFGAKLIKVGNSFGVIVPLKVVKAKNLSKGSRFKLKVLGKEEYDEGEDKQPA